MQFMSSYYIIHLKRKIMSTMLEVLLDQAIGLCVQDFNHQGKSARIKIFI